MKYVRLLFILLFIISSMQLAAQQKFTWRGYVKDSLSGETLINASIILNNETRGVSTNQYGYFFHHFTSGHTAVYFLVCWLYINKYNH